MFFFIKAIYKCVFISFLLIAPIHIHGHNRMTEYNCDESISGNENERSEKKKFDIPKWVIKICPLSGGFAHNLIQIIWKRATTKESKKKEKQTIDALNEQVLLTHDNDCVSIDI